jgi:hypothetical protein
MGAGASGGTFLAFVVFGAWFLMRGLDGLGVI